MEAKDIDYSEMVRALAKPGDAILASLTPEKAHLLHMAVGISGEAGELLEAGDSENIKEELGDIEFYREGLLQGLNVSVDMLELPTDDLFDADIGVAIYASRILDAVKKAAVYNKDLDVAEVCRSIAGLDYAMTTVRDDLGITREDCINANKYKLALGPKARYKAGTYSDQQAQDRADKVA